MFLDRAALGRLRGPVRRPDGRPHHDPLGQVPAVHPVRLDPAAGDERAHLRVPQGWDGGAQLLYAYLTYAVLGLIYSMVNVPYGSLATAMTQVSRERAKLAVARGLGAGLAGLLLTFIIAPQIQTITANKALSAEDRADQLQSVFLPDHPAVRRRRLRACTS